MKNLVITLVSVVLLGVGMTSCNDEVSQVPYTDDCYELKGKTLVRKTPCSSEKNVDEYAELDLVKIGKFISSGEQDTSKISRFVNTPASQDGPNNLDVNHDMIVDRLYLKEQDGVISIVHENGKSLLGIKYN